MQAKDLCPYKENKSKYFLPKKLRGFQEGLDEIEKTPLIKFGAENRGKLNKKDDNTSDKKVKKYWFVVKTNPINFFSCFKALIDGNLLECQEQKADIKKEIKQVNTSCCSLNFLNKMDMFTNILSLSFPAGEKAE